VATIHRTNIGNIDVIEDVIRQFAQEHACRVGHLQEPVQYNPDFPDWKLGLPAYEGEIHVSPNIWFGTIGIFVLPFLQNKIVLSEGRCSVFDSLGSADYVRKVCLEKLIIAGMTLHWRA